MMVKDWFNSLQPRERYLVVGGSVIVLILLVYLWLLEPVSKEVSQLRTTVASGENQILWMQNASAEAQTLKGGASRNNKVDTRTSLITAVERSASSSGIRAQLKRMEPQGSKKISTEFKAVGFDQLINWLGVLEKNYAAKTVQLNSTRGDASGRVDARIIISRGDS